jgi:hypothetical protein
MVHRTLSDVPARRPLEAATLGNSRACSAIIHETVRCAIGLSGEPVEQRLPACQRSTLSSEQCSIVREEVRATKSEGLRTVRCS